MKDSWSCWCFGSSSVLLPAYGHLWLASAVRHLGLFWIQCSLYTDITANASTWSRHKICKKNIAVTNRKKIFVIPLFFCFLVFFGFGSVVSQDEKGEKIGNRPTHPGELDCPWKVWVQRMRRHTTTVPHCNAKGDIHRETRDESKNVFGKGLERGLADTVGVAVTKLTVYCTEYFQAMTLKARSKNLKNVDMLELSDLPCSCIQYFFCPRTGLFIEIRTNPANHITTATCLKHYY